MTNHLLLWFSIFSFATGFSSIVFTAISYLKYKKKIILIYAIYLIAIAIEVIGTIFHIQYESILDILHKYPSLSMMRLLLANIGLFLIVITIPIGIHIFLSIKMSFLKKIIFITFICINLLALIIEPFFHHNQKIIDFICQYIEIPIFYILMTYSLIAALMNLKNTNDKNLKMAILIFAIISLPIFLYEFVIEIFKLYLIESLPIPFYFFILNFLTIFFHLKFFNEPVYCINNQPTEYFFNKFNISNRESEIISLIVKGFTNKEICDKLCISLKTVESHLGSSYKKTNSKNRIQLFNLINRNQG